MAESELCDKINDAEQIKQYKISDSSASTDNVSSWTETNFSSVSLIIFFIISSLNILNWNIQDKNILFFVFFFI